MGIYSSDLRPIEEGCECECCKNYTRAALHLLFRSNQSVAASILSIHNLYHQKRLMSEMRESIINGRLTHKFKDSMNTSFRILDFKIYYY